MPEVEARGHADGRIAELVELAKQTTSRLSVLWKEVGYSAEEKGRQMEGLIDGFRTLCDNKEKEEKDVKNTFVASIADAKDRIKKARSVLGHEAIEVLYKSLADSSAHEMSLTDQLAYFEMEADALKKLCMAQQEQFQKISQAIVHMSEVLGEDSDAAMAQWQDVDSSLTDERLQQFKDKEAELSKATEDREATIVSLLRTVQDLMQDLQLSPTTPLDNRVLGSLVVPSAGEKYTLQTTERTSSSTGISKMALDELYARQEELLLQRNARREKLEKMGEEILDLWNQLGISKDEQDIFAESVEGIGPQTLEAGEIELNRLRELKRERMGDLIYDARTRIQELWDNMGCTEPERGAFKPMLVTEEGFTDELLQQHTREADNLSSRFETMRHILEKIEERENLVHQRLENETSSKDPSRLVPKGSAQERRQRQKRLQQELDAEKRIKNRLPALTANLSKIIPQWEKAQSVEFLYKGERYLDVMQRSEEDFATLKDQIKAAKDAKKKEERRKLAMASPAAKPSNSVALGRETPRSTRKVPGSSRKGVGPTTSKVPRTPMHRTACIDKLDGDIVTPDRLSGEPSASSDLSVSTITDVSNQVDNNSGVNLGPASKQRTSSGGKEDTENSSISSALETFEGFDS